MNNDKVAADNFYKDNGDKIKQNWFLYEFSNILFSKIEGSHKLASYRKKHSQEEISEFCVYLSKRLRQSISNAEKKLTPGVTINGRYVYEFYPGNTYAQTQRLLDVALEAWDEHVTVCSSCPNQCLTDGFEITDKFDNLAKTGWPTI
jgi:hypothetical protein